MIYQRVLLVLKINVVLLYPLTIEIAQKKGLLTFLQMAVCLYVKISAIIIAKGIKFSMMI